MNQHPIPQNVTAYQFRLIGDMTIKQFIFLSVGIAAAIFFYYTNLFLPIKWFFVLFSAMVGFAMAFLPLEERPLDQWLVNYLRAIYRPTRFIWRKQSEVPKYFSFSSNQTISPADSQELARAAAIRRQQGLRSYLITLPSDQNGSAIDTQEETVVHGLLGLFGPTQTTTAPNPAPITPPQNIFRPQPASIPLPAPVAAAPVITKAASPTIAAPETSPLPTSAQPKSETISVGLQNSPTVTATSSPNLPFPSTPSTPNTLVGMVLNSSNKIVENAIIEVTDEAGLPVRATKTNQLGQFFSTTPLKPGTYRLNVEKAGLAFDTIEIALSNQIVNPLKIQAKA